MTYTGGITVAVHGGFVMVQTAFPQRLCQAAEPQEHGKLREAFEQAYWTVRDKA